MLRRLHLSEFPLSGQHRFFPRLYSRQLIFAYRSNMRVGSCPYRHPSNNADIRGAFCARESDFSRRCPSSKTRISEAEWPAIPILEDKKRHTPRGGTDECMCFPYERTRAESSERAVCPRERGFLWTNPPTMCVLYLAVTLVALVDRGSYVHARSW